jgi:hypothetical protein
MATSSRVPVGGLGCCAPLLPTTAAPVMIAAQAALMDEHEPLHALLLMSETARHYPGATSKVQRPTAYHG